MLVSVAAVGLNLLLNWVFTLQLGWGHRGLAFSTACIATTNFLVLYLLMRRRLQSLDTSVMAHMVGQLLPGSLILTGICWLGSHYLLAGWATQAFWPKLLGLTLTIGIGAAAFIGCALAARVAELDQLGNVLKRRFRRGRPG